MKTQTSKISMVFSIGLMAFVLMALFLFSSISSTPVAAKGAPPPATATPTPGSATPTPEPTATPSSPGLVWSDEFDGPDIDLNNWTYDLGWGTDGWGNMEEQSYKVDNAWIENGELIIEARAERDKGQQYTSARLKTQGLQEFQYGRIEARVRVPYGQGIWPAFWMLGTDIEQVGWPNSGEIDIMEHIGSEPSTVYGTVHGPGYAGAEGVGGGHTINGNLTDNYHVYAVEWSPTEIKWYFNNVNYATVTPNDVPGEWVYDHPFFIIINVAVGGYWPGSPDETTVFPQRMYIDYIRVYNQ